MTYRVDHHAYCGMPIPLGEGFTFHEALVRAGKRIKWFRKRIGGNVVRLTETLNAMKWELQEPEDCLMVPDACGVLVIRAEECDEDNEDCA